MDVVVEDDGVEVGDPDSFVGEVGSPADVDVVLFGEGVEVVRR